MRKVNALFLSDVSHCCSNWDEWHSLRMKANKQIVPRKIVQFAPQIYDMSGDVVDCIRAKREKDNTVKDVLPILMDWSVEGASRALHIECICITIIVFIVYSPGRSLCMCLNLRIVVDYFTMYVHCRITVY